MLKTHYRQPIDFTVKGLEESLKTLEKWYDRATAGADVIDTGLMEALQDDMNTPGAMAALHQLDGAALGAGLGLLGFSLDKSALQNGPAVDEGAIQAAIEARLAARAAKNWAESDRIRDDLLAKGIQLKDGKGSDGQPVTTWEVKR